MNICSTKSSNITHGYSEHIPILSTRLGNTPPPPPPSPNNIANSDKQHCSWIVLFSLSINIFINSYMYVSCLYNKNRGNIIIMYIIDWVVRTIYCKTTSIRCHTCFILLVNYRYYIQFITLRLWIKA